MRKLSFCIALIVMLCLTSAAFAQDTAITMPCGDLSEEDCAILTNAQTASATVDSQVFDFSFNVDISDVPGMNEPLAFSLTGNGAFTGMTALQSSMTAAQTAMMGMTDLAAMQENLGEIAEALRGFGGDLNLTLTLPANLMAMFSPDTANEVTLQILLVDGFAYTNLDTLEPILSSAGASGMSGWIGIDLVGLMQAAFEQIDPDMLEESMDMTSSDAITGYMEAFSDPAFIENFMTVERTDDGSGETAVFEFTFDFGGLISSPAFQDVMREQMRQQMEAMGGTISDEEIGEALAMSSQMMKGIGMSMTEEIGLEDGFIHSIIGSMSFDMGGMMAALGEMGELNDNASEAEAAPVINVGFSVNYSDFNNAPEITAPEDAMVIPYQTLLGGGATDEAPAMEMTPTPTPAS